MYSASGDYQLQGRMRDINDRNAKGCRITGVATRSRNVLIAHVITRLLRAGSEENTVATCLSQASEGHDVLLFHGAEWSPLLKARCGSAVRLIEVRDLVHNIDLRKDIMAIRALCSLFQETKPDIVHTHQSKAGIVGRVAARLACVPAIVHGVHILPFVNVGPIKKATYVVAERAVARFTTAFINVSEGTRQTCLDHGIGRPEQHFVAHSGMDISRFQQATLPDDWRAISGVSENEKKPPVVLMLAALEARKRHGAFLEVFDRVIRRIPDVRLLIAGEGPMRDAIEATIASRNLGPNVRVLGFDAHPERLIALSDLTVLTSVREGLPRVIVQSLAGGRPVVTTDLPGIGDIVKNGINGVVTSRDDLGVTADAVADLLTDTGRLSRMQVFAADTDVSKWTTDSMCNAISQIYRRLVPDRRLAG
jgi:glycosyltransferase involved in cell wall biosynthesis